jgi:hypothetical protein
MDFRQRRMELLRRVQAGELSAEDGNRYLAELEQLQAEQVADLPIYAPGPTPAPGNPIGSAPDGFIQENPLDQPDRDASKAEAAQPSAPHPEVIEPIQPAETVQPAGRVSGWRSLWLLPFLLGLFLTLVSVNWMYLGLATAGLSWGFWLSFFPFAVGILLMWAGWELNTSRWLHVRIRQRPGARPLDLAFSVPLPLGLTRWAIQRFGRFSPQVNRQDLDEFLREVDQATTVDGAMHLFVDDYDGEQVDIWIEGKNR